MLVRPQACLSSPEATAANLAAGYGLLISHWPPRAPSSYQHPLRVVRDPPFLSGIAAGSQHAPRILQDFSTMDEQKKCSGINTALSYVDSAFSYGASRASPSTFSLDMFSGLASFIRTGFPYLAFGGILSRRRRLLASQA